MRTWVGLGELRQLIGSAYSGGTHIWVNYTQEDCLQ